MHSFFFIVWFCSRRFTAWWFCWVSLSLDIFGASQVSWERIMEITEGFFCGFFLEVNGAVVKMTRCVFFCKKALEQWKRPILWNIVFPIDFNVLFHSPEITWFSWRSFMKLTMAGMFLSVPLLFAMHAWLDTIAKRDSYGQEAWQHGFHMFSPQNSRKTH